MEMPRKYRALRWIGVIATVAAWVVLVLCVLVLLVVIPQVGVDWARTLLSVLLLLVGVSTFLQFFVKGNVLLMLSDMESQTRASSQTLDRIRSLLETAKPSATSSATVQVESPAQVSKSLPEAAKASAESK